MALVNLTRYCDVGPHKGTTAAPAVYTTRSFRFQSGIATEQVDLDTCADHLTEGCEEQFASGYLDLYVRKLG